MESGSVGIPAIRPLMEPARTSRKREEGVNDTQLQGPIGNRDTDDLVGQLKKKNSKSN